MLYLLVWAIQICFAVDVCEMAPETLLDSATGQTTCPLKDLPAQS